MIVRIMGWGQYRLDDAAMAPLHEADERVEAAVAAGDERAFAVALSDLVGVVLDAGRSLPADEIVPSDAIVPAPGTTLEDTRRLLSSEGLIPDPA